MLVFCSVMVVWQFNANKARHDEVREAFILLHSRGYTNQALRLYYRLLLDVGRVPNQVLVADFDRTLMLVEPTVKQPNNLIWKYHWTVSNELEKRSEKSILRALRLADEEDKPESPLPAGQQSPGATQAGTPKAASP